MFLFSFDILFSLTSGLNNSFKTFINGGMAESGGAGSPLLPKY